MEIFSVYMHLAGRQKQKKKKEKKINLSCEKHRLSLYLILFGAQWDSNVHLTTFLQPCNLKIGFF